jgi:AraC family transcriptional regulator of adaptative response/methylated-DNA-[protein]-cysteine methyltransferase
MLRAGMSRDASYDGLFFVAVKTTKIFCLPSCPARSPKPENVTHYATAREALFAGFRPCKRCRPLEAGGEAPAWVRPLLAEVDAAPEERVSDSVLRQRGYEPAKVRRFFSQRYGMTFQAYCRGRRLGKAFNRIKEGASLDDVTFGSGFESASGFREAFSRTFGIAPGQADAVDPVRLGWMESPVGPLLLGATDEGACFCEFTDRRSLENQIDVVRRRFARPVVPGTNEPLERLQQELLDYFSGKLRDFTVPLIVPGSPFETSVWNVLRTIPYGETISYSDLAQAIDSPRAVRAVGSANGRNRMAIVIPCHRVVNHNGALGGYGGGLWRKRWLLDLEQRNSGMFA